MKVVISTCRMIVNELVIIMAHKLLRVAIADEATDVNFSEQVNRMQC